MHCPRPLRWLPALALGLACSAPPEVVAPADARLFEPPRDGCLRSEHVERYLTVLRRAAVLRRDRVASFDRELTLTSDGGLAGLRRAYEAVDGLRELAGLEEQAARELGFDPHEHAWVAATLEEAELTLAEAEMRALAEDPEERSNGRNGRRPRQAVVDDPEQRAQLANEGVLRRYRRALEQARGGGVHSVP
ncbi:MAG: hypothetical protein AAF604_20365 [Acidobacteriota bacterium]